MLKLSYEQVAKEIEFSQKEIQYSKIRIIVLLITSSICLILWSSFSMKFDFFLNLRYVASLPFVFNIFAWVIYLLPYIIPFAFSYNKYFKREKEYNYNDMDIDVLQKSQMIAISLYKQRKIERIIIPFIAMQFIIISAILALLHLIRY